MHIKLWLPFLLWLLLHWRKLLIIDIPVAFMSIINLLSLLGP